MHWTWALLPFLAGTVIKFGACVYSLLRTRAQYLSVKVWFALLFLQDILYWFFLLRFGANSFAYAIVYFWADFIATFLGLVVLIRLAETSFRKAKINIPFFRAGAMAILAGICVLSFIATFQKLAAAPHHLKALIVLGIALEQHSAAAAMLVSVLLFIALTVLLVSGTRVRRLVAGFAILYSCTALTASAMQLFGPVVDKSIPWISVFALAFMAHAISEPERTDNPRRRQLAFGRFQPARLETGRELLGKVGA